MDALAESDDWLEIERLIREHVGLPEALRILEPGAGSACPYQARDMPNQSGAMRVRQIMRRRFSDYPTAAIYACAR